METDNNTVLHTVLKERKSYNYLKERDNAAECLITALSCGSAGTIELADLHFLESKVKRFSQCDCLVLQRFS